MSKTRAEIISDIQALANDSTRPMSEREIDLDMIEEDLQEIKADLETEEEEEICDDCGEPVNDCVCYEEDDEEDYDEDEDEDE